MRRSRSHEVARSLRLVVHGDGSIMQTYGLSVKKFKS